MTNPIAQIIAESNLVPASGGGVSNLHDTHAPDVTNLSWPVEDTHTPKFYKLVTCH